MLKGVKVTYDRLQDRLELVLVQSDKKVYRLHVTRRVAASWLAQLGKLIEKAADAPLTVDAVSRKAIAAAHHDAMARTATYSKQLELPADKEIVTGDRPALVTRVRCGQHRNGRQLAVSFDMSAGGSLSLLVAESTLHGLVAILVRELTRANWGLALLPSGKMSAAPTPRALH